MQASMPALVGGARHLESLATTEYQTGFSDGTDGALWRFVPVISHLLSCLNLPVGWLIDSSAQ